MKTWTCTALFLNILTTWLSGRVFTYEFVQLCSENMDECKQLKDYDDGLQNKRLVLFGRALSGDGFFRFGRGQGTFPFIGRNDRYPSEDKRILRFGRISLKNADDLLAALTFRIDDFGLEHNVNLRKKRSNRMIEASNFNTILATKAEEINNNEETNDEQVRGENAENKRLMKIDRNSEELDSKQKWSEIDKLYIRIGRNSNDIMQDEKRFLRIGRNLAAEKRFLRIGRDLANGFEKNKRVMRIGRNQEDMLDVADTSNGFTEAEKRYLRIGRKSDTEKRFLRIGRDPGDLLEEEKRFMRIGREPDKEKRFLRIGRSFDKQFLRFGRDGEVKPFMEIGQE